MYVRIPRPALPAASALAAVCAVAVGTPGRVGVGVPERAVISGRNPLPPPRGGPGSAQRLPDLLRDDRGRVLAGDYREKRGDRVLFAGPSSPGSGSVFPLAAACLIQSSAAA